MGPGSGGGRKGAMYRANANAARSFHVALRTLLLKRQRHVYGTGKKSARKKRHVDEVLCPWFERETSRMAFTCVCTALPSTYCQRHAKSCTVLLPVEAVKSRYVD